MKVVSIIGARPQFMKIAPIIRELDRFNSCHPSPITIHHLLVHTGQHYDYLMSKVFFDELGIPEPDYNLEVGSASHGTQTGYMLERAEQVLLKERPDWVLVYGDTNSTLAGALAASKIYTSTAQNITIYGWDKKAPLSINPERNTPAFKPGMSRRVYYSKELGVNSKLDAVTSEQLSVSNLINSKNPINARNPRGYRPLIAHVEAGLRSFDREMPEEHNRVLTDHCSDLLFCPTQTAVDNLAREGITHGVHLVGDTMYDAVLQFSEIARQRSTILQDLGLKPKGYLLATVHRPCNTDIPENLRNILAAFAEISEPVIFPVHPRTRQCMAKFGLSNARSALPTPLNLEAIQPGRNLKFIDPVGYLDMLALEKNARLILTDSGGMQKEAYFFGVPCVTLRTETEWIETVEAGWNIVVGVEPKKIGEAVRGFHPQGERSKVFGDGRASKRIVAILEGQENG